MQNYRFSVKAAKQEPVEELFKMALVLIEVQRKANMFRAGLAVPDLKDTGICGNMDQVLSVCVDHYDIFFEGRAYPIEPYSNRFGSGNVEDYWGHNAVGNRRIAMIDRMVKDLIHYLTYKAG
jgi:hypothetical protein